MFARVGEVERARLLLGDLESQTEPNAYFLIHAYVALGMTDKAFSWKYGAAWWVRVDPLFDDLRLDPRWDELMAVLKELEK